MDGVLEQLGMAGRQAAQARNWAKVKACAREILNRDRRNAEGRFLLGLSEKAAKRTQQAIEAFKLAWDTDRARYDAAVELASQYLHTHEYGKACALLDRCVSLMQNSPMYLDMAATIYVNIGLPERGMPLYRRADELQPGVDVIRANLAACSVYVGDIDDAISIYSELLRKNPAHQRNHYELSRLRRAKDDAHVEQMKSVLEQSGLPPAQNVYLYYGIGKELEDLERWDEAFEYYKRGGDAAASISGYDVASDVELIDTVIERCNEGWLQAKPAEATESTATPLFIVGLPRTGTTLTERILSCHSQVESIGESFFIQIGLKQTSGVRTADAMSPAIVRAAAKKDARRLRQSYLNAIEYRRGDAPVFIEKFPENMLHLGFIARSFPDARILLVNRNPMDACFAQYKQSYFRYAYTLGDLGQYYVAWHRLREHWRGLLGDRLVEVDYEQLVSDQEAQTRLLLESLQLPFESACLEFEKNAAASNTASTIQIRERAHTRSVMRWKCYEKQLESLLRHLESAGIAVE